MMMQKMAGLARSFLIYYGIPGRQRRMRRFYGQFIRPGDLCFDVGAHLGNRIGVWRALGARVVAVEPQPEMMRWLERLYGRSANVTLLQTAVGAAPGAATLHVSSRNPTVSTLSAEWITAVQQDPSFASVQWDEQVTVPVTTLSALIRQYGLPAFCKLDIEGYELEALQGLDVPLPALSFEHIPASSDLTEACLKRLQELGDYCFNYSPGETHKLLFDAWLTAEELLHRLAQLPPGSGDVYGRRGEDWRLETGDWRLGRTRD
jgi:FkbM family methyltransferase